MPDPPEKSGLVQEWAGELGFTRKTVTWTPTTCAFVMKAEDGKGRKVPNSSQGFVRGY